MGSYFVIEKVDVVKEQPKDFARIAFRKDTPEEYGCSIPKEFLIDGDRLRYGYPEKGEWFFDFRSGLWDQASIDFTQNKQWILDPLPKEQDEFERWLEECPIKSGFALSTEPINIAKMLVDVCDWVKDVPRPQK